MPLRVIKYLLLLRDANIKFCSQAFILTIALLYLPIIIDRLHCIHIKVNNGNDCEEYMHLHTIEGKKFRRFNRWYIILKLFWISMSRTIDLTWRCNCCILNRMTPSISKASEKKRRCCDIYYSSSFVFSGMSLINCLNTTFEINLLSYWTLETNATIFFDILVLHNSSHCYC